MKFLLQLGGSTDQLFMLQTALAMGYGVVVLDANPAAPGLKLAPYAAPIDFSDIPRVIEYVDRLRADGVDVAGVSTMGSDIPQLIARIAAHYGWPGISVATGDLATDKLAMKQRLEQQGIPVPRYALVDSATAVIAQWRRWSCPRIIIKPTDRAGSRGVSLVAYESDCQAAFEYARSSGRSGAVLMEAFIAGPQISTESILFDERSATPGFADRVYTGMEVFHPQIMENGGWVPSSLSQDIQQQVSVLAEQAARALGIQRGVAKGDLVIDAQRGPLVIEIAARLSGGDFCESLVPLGTGVNYVREVIRMALGEAPQWSELTPHFQKAVANRYFFLPPGRLEAVTGVPSLETRPELKKFELFYQMGSNIPRIQNHGQRVGVFVVVGETHTSVQQIVAEIYAAVSFKIDGNWVNGRPVVV